MSPRASVFPRTRRWMVPMVGRLSRLVGIFAASAALFFASGFARAQSASLAPAKTQSPPSSLSSAPNTGAGPYGMPINDRTIFMHVLLDQFEGRSNGPDNEFRWDGEGWIGTDFNRLWFKSEGFLSNGVMSDGDQEILYDRPIPFMRYFDWQAGLRYDLDSFPGRAWFALGVEGLAPQFFDVEATAYARNAGHFAARLMTSYDILITQRLIAQPEIEMNFYSKKDRAREVGTGLSEIDTGFRVRYEISRKFAPYIGVAYNGKFGETADFARNSGEIVNDVRFVFGTRLWY